MGKRFIERPTTRQILTQAERQIIREQAKIRTEQALESNADWLAQNFPKPKAEPRKVPRISVEDARSAADWAQFKRFEAMDDDNVTPDPLGKTGHYEPKSIYDPAPPSRIRREAPKKRKPRDPYATSTDCELPEYRAKATYTIEDANGVARGVIRINPFSKRITIGGFGLSDRK